MKLFNEFNAVIAEITCTAEQAREPWNPVEKLIEFLNRENLRFAVEECLVSKKEILKHPHWKEWRESQVEDVPDEVTVFILFSSKKNKPEFDRLFIKWVKENEKLFKNSWRCLSPVNPPPPCAEVPTKADPAC